MEIELQKERSSVSWAKKEGDADSYRAWRPSCGSVDSSKIILIAIRAVVATTCNHADRQKKL